MSQAPTLEDLYDFEGNFETAIQSVLATAGVTAYISQSSGKLPLINTGIAFDLGPAIDEKDQIPKPSNWPANTAAPQEYFRYTANVGLTVEVPRDENTNDPTPPEEVATVLGEIRAKCRAAMMQCCLPFPESILPYYSVSDIRPNGATTGWEQKRNVDFMILGWVITFAIRPDAWPAWVES